MNSGGAERVAAHLANYWSSRGDDVTLLLTFSGGGECFYPIVDSVKVFRLNDLAKHSGRSPLAYWARYWTLRRFIRTSNPDVVVSFLINVNISTLLATIGLDCPVIISERSYPPAETDRRILGVLRRIFYPRASRVLMLTREGLNWLESHIPNAKGIIIPNPVAIPLPGCAPQLKPGDFIASERKLLLAVGRLDEGKQFDRLLDSFAGLTNRHPLWSLAILGEGSDRIKLERQISALGIQRQVSLPGSVGNMGDWYHRADLYVLSSRYEGFPNTLAEAMAHGRAAVSYDCETGPRDIIEHGQNGLLVVPVGDVPALTRALDRLMGDDTEREHFAGQAIKVQDRYAPTKIMSVWDAIINTVLEEAAAR